MQLDEKDLALINSLLKRNYTKTQIIALSKDAMWDLINNDLSVFIGYDEKKGDIDDLGLKVDNIISKLLKMLEIRGDT